MRDLAFSSKRYVCLSHADIASKPITVRSRGFPSGSPETLLFKDLFVPQVTGEHLFESVKQDW